MAGRFPLKTGNGFRLRDVAGNRLDTGEGNDSDQFDREESPIF
jgi:hypothetical protein